MDRTVFTSRHGPNFLESRAKMKIRFDVDKGCFVCRRGSDEVALTARTFKSAVHEAFDKNLYSTKRSGDVSSRRKTG